MYDIQTKRDWNPIESHLHVDMFGYIKTILIPNRNLLVIRRPSRENHETQHLLAEGEERPNTVKEGMI